MTAKGTDLCFICVRKLHEATLFFEHYKVNVKSTKYTYIYVAFLKTFLCKILIATIKDVFIV